MRGLRGAGAFGAGRPAPRGGLAVGATVVVLAAVGLFTAACSTGGDGVQDEGSAPSTGATGAAAPKPRPTGGPLGLKVGDPLDVDVVKLLRQDAKAGDWVRTELKGCTGGNQADDFPVHTSYGYLTGGRVPDVVVNVLSCTDGVGLATFVYRVDDTRYENVFSLEEPGVNAVIDRGDLEVTREIYGEKDPASNPSAVERVIYRWKERKFERAHWSLDKNSGAVGQDELTASEVNPPKNEN
ncbi:hypothetical protein ABT354_05160 [Streptomyces sp. NPDC000594]|uniref:hypothetical protein n=1 Tax=Streptomyces sp. NPDC000594 TaxID=3154261 RepID=UPI0033315D9B